MGNLAFLKIATGCGVTDFLLAEEIRDFCDLWVVFGGILLVILLLLFNKNLVEKQG